ncbi:MAG: O-antigen ligase family protein [Puniceicoccales bacterium]|jgi:hypothetical protein|nr:O-antigen ligase family protein [Puniceicoccales bacterium]
MNIALFGSTIRLDWGFGNPNKTAALIASILIAIWVIPQIARALLHGKNGWKSVVFQKILWWATFCATGYCAFILLKTGSRGGAAAVFFGFSLLFVLSAKQKILSKGKIVAIFLLIGAVGVVASLMPQTGRFAPERSLQDASLHNRWLIWKNVPSMLVAAPDGWGLGKSGEIFIEWYQSPGRQERYRTLVNSHATWLVEFGWLLRIAYLFAWLTAFRLAWPDRCKEGESLEPFPNAPLGVLGTFFLAATFSSVAEEWQLWIVPGLMLGVCLFFRWRRKQWPNKKRFFTMVSAFVLGLILLVQVVGRLSNVFPLSVENGGETARIGCGPVGVVVAAGEKSRETPRDLRSVLGAWDSQQAIIWTRRLREGMLAEGENPRLIVFSEVYTVPPPGILKRAREIILLSPRFSPTEFSPEVLGKMKVFVGEFSSATPVAQEWMQRPECTVVLGMADYFEGWHDMVLGRQ